LASPQISPSAIPHSTVNSHVFWMLLT
jgi:hypothetical protein